MDKAPGDGSVALAVDLDGTLLKTDLLVESALELLSHRPWMVFRFPFWLMRGKAHLKREIARRVELDLASMPWDERVLGLVREHSGRRPLALCTASDEKLASAVAEHLGMFDVVLASDGSRNLSGPAKAAVLCERYGERGFDYAGNERADLAVWAQARAAIVVNAPASLARAAGRSCTLDRHWPAEGPRWKSWTRELRLHQWLKNILVFVPMLAAHQFLDPQAWLRCATGWFAFSLCASSTYLVNDLLDLTADRHHPGKRNRPFASGRLPLTHGLIVAPLLMLAAFGVAFRLSPFFAGVLAVYYVLTLAYSFRLKKRVMVDVIALAGLYTVRIIAGSVLVATPPSFWLLAFSMFLFLSLAMVKRYTELLGLVSRGKDKASGRGYSVEDLPLVQSLGAASGYQAVLVLALYINSTASELLYRRPQVLWLLCPLLLYWISRVWIIAHRGLMREDPVVFAATDRTSQVILLACAAIAAGAI
ncbi:MAG TPA: UbiA family prenyltransferase [Xanthomonadaceae bacterium]|jgi:4-hydroxybenzoate polyprenyltransferase